MAAVILRGDARALPLPDESVDLIVTSPPYWGQRDYRDNGASLDGQIGNEPTPGEFIDNLLACTREWTRVLKPSGSMFVVLGDKYATSGGHGSSATSARAGRRSHQAWADRAERNTSGTPLKSLLCLPERYRIACIDQLGLIARSVITWCLSGGARLYARTKSGDRPIMLRDLVRSYRPEEVHLWNGAQWTQVLGWNRSPDRDGALELELRTGERIGCTPGHRWPTQRGVLRAAELRIGDIVQTTRLPEPDVPHQPAALNDEDIGWLVGLYMAEGSRSEKTLQFAGHRREELRHARLARIAAAYHGNCAVYQTSENGVSCNLNGAALLGIIDHYIGRGRTAKSKRLRKAVWQRSDRFLAAVVDGYLSGDGHFDAKNNRWRLGFSANDEWAADLRTLAARLGAKLSLRRHDHTFAGRAYPGWRGEWRWDRSTYHSAKQDGEIVAIRQSRARGFYDVGVADEPHLFALASGVLTHNSKPNGLPESVTDRVRRSHEDIVHLVKQSRYYSGVDEIREVYAPGTGGRQRAAARGTFDYAARAADYSAAVAAEQAGMAPQKGFYAAVENPLGKLPGSVWEIAEGETLVRSVLRAVEAGGITIDEGERLLAWLTHNGSGRTWHAATDAGNGRDFSTAPGMGGTTPSASKPDERTASPTNSKSDRSATDSQSTTSAGTSDACGQSTSKQSRTGSTSTDESGQSAAPTDTSTPETTSTSAKTGNENVEPAFGVAPGSTGSVSAAPPSVWTIATQPLKVPEHIAHADCCGGQKRSGCDGLAHYAAFPPALVRRIILGWSPPGICTACGEGRRPVVDACAVPVGSSTSGGIVKHAALHKTDGRVGQAKRSEATITGYACACPEPTAPTRPALVVDAFGGTGTTALVADVLGRNAISIDRSADYCRLARWRVNDPAERARALGVPKPPPVMDGQGDLFEEVS